VHDVETLTLVQLPRAMGTFPLAWWGLYPIIVQWVGRVNGLEHVPRQQAFILAANHASYLDHPLLVAALLPRLDRMVHFLAKREHFDKLFLRWWHRYSGAIPIDREAGGREGLKKGLEVLAHGKILAIHPEGTRSRDGKLQPGKPGVAWLARQAGVPVLPVGLIGTHLVLPPGGRIPALRRIEVHVGEPLGPTELFAGGRDLEDATRVIMAAIAGLCEPG